MSNFYPSPSESNSNLNHDYSRGPDEVHLIKHLLYRTTLTVKIGSAHALPFQSTIGTPQGDSLSPVLFVCYLEAALRDCRARFPPRPPGDIDTPHETGYADDINLYSTSRPWLNTCLPIISETLGDWSLTVNPQKTEWVHITAASTAWCGVRQLGSLIGEADDIRRRINLASQVYGQMYTLWLRRREVSEGLRVQLYKAIVIPTLLYNCETWGPPQSALSELDRFHRKQLRNLLGIHYPRRISNADLYERTGSCPLSEIVSQRRLRMAGHVLRLDPASPPYRAMEGYFDAKLHAARGRPCLTLATTLIRDLRNRDIHFRRRSDLATVRNHATDKSNWKIITNPH